MFTIFLQISNLTHLIEIEFYVAVTYARVYPLNPFLIKFSTEISPLIPDFDANNKNYKVKTLFKFFIRLVSANQPNWIPAVLPLCTREWLNKFATV